MTSTTDSFRNTTQNSDSEVRKQGKSIEELKRSMDATREGVMEAVSHHITKQLAN